MSVENREISSSYIKDKLPHDAKHLQALQRMRSLRPYYKWTKKLFEGYLGKRVMDAGCGIGNFCELISKDVDFILAVDLSPSNLKILKQRFAENQKVKIGQLDLDNDIEVIRENKIDTIVCLDVLEHIKQDIVMLKNFKKIIEPNGKLLVKVPACPWLFGNIDEASGHFRRYSRKMLLNKLREAGWKPLFVSYMNIFGILPYFVKSRIKKRNSNFSSTFSPWQLSLLRMIMPILQKIDNLMGPPIGQSIVVVAE